VGDGFINLSLYSTSYTILVWWCITAEKICGRCNRSFDLNEHPSGLVFNDHHFLCEECTHDLSSDNLNIWTRTVMQSPSTGMPIALWLIHEQNKDKTIMSKLR